MGCFICCVDMHAFVSYSNCFSPGAGWHADPCVQLQHLGASPHVWGPLWLHPLHRCPSNPALHPHQQWYASKLMIFSSVNIPYRLFSFIRHRTQVCLYTGVLKCIWMVSVSAQMTCWSNCGTGRRSGRAARCLRVTLTMSCRLSSTPRTTISLPVPPWTGRLRYRQLALALVTFYSCYFYLIIGRVLRGHPDLTAVQYCGLFNDYSYF